MEDIPADLKSTQHSTISIFLEYARNKSLPRVDDANEDTLEPMSIEPRRRNRGIRRQQSEPHGRGEPQVRVVVETDTLRETAASELAEMDPEDGEQLPRDTTAKPRPSTLLLSASVAGASRASDKAKPSSPKHKRVPSNCESTTTPVPDPPLFSPASLSALEATYPPARDNFNRSRSSSSPLPLPYGWQRHQVALGASSGQLELPGMDPQNARIIAERLKIIGDKLEQEHGEERLSSLVNSFVSFGVDQPITITRFLRLLRNLRSRLNWKKVSEVFVVGYRLLEIMTQATTKPFEDERWWLFERLWDFMVNTVARWVMENGGWGAFLLATDHFESEPASHHVERSPNSPAIAATSRTRLWSLSESGSIVDEDGISLSETITANNEGSGVCEASASGELLASPPGSTLSLEHDSGIVSSMEHLSLDTQDTEGHFASNSCTSVVSESQGSEAQGLQAEGDPLMGAGTATSPTDESDSEPQLFDRNRTRSLPIRGRSARPKMPRRASERALDGLLYTVNIGVSAAFVYAVVSSLLNK